jgi:hypothetical protein
MAIDLEIQSVMPKCVAIQIDLEVRRGANTRELTDPIKERDWAE